MGINYQHLADAVKFYGDKYAELQVPWIVNEKAISSTSPFGVKLFSTFAGHLVASGEQSFVQLLLDGKLPPGRWMCVTPCFRNEESLTKFHHMHFMKVELISYYPIDNDDHVYHYHELCKREEEEMIKTALAFFQQYVPAEVVKTNVGFDIQSNGLELGSYGIREAVGCRWVFGTGCAEPRLSDAIIRSGNQLLP